MLRLRGYTDAELRSQFARHRDDLVQLDALNRELNSRDTDEAFDLQIEVVQVLTSLRKAAQTNTRGDAVAAWLKAFLLSRRMSAADGRPLHQYRMSDAEYESARLLLKASRSRLDRDDGPAASLFVAFCAEWFRREATSFFLRWDALAPDVFSTIPHNRRRNLVEVGLNYWKRSLIKSETATEFLLTIAIEGGISAHVISEYGSSWLAEYLRKLMRFALADGNRDHVRGFAGDMSNEIRISFRQDGFIDLCCELILKLVEWKRVADQGPPGVDPLSFLDARHPDWKDSLPIYMPADDDRIARRLLSGLLVEKAGPVAGSGITVDRYLKFEAGIWRPAIALTADGEVSPGKLPGVSSARRWKAIPSGQLANYLPSQIALFEPPTEDQQKWRVRSLTPLDSLLVGMPLAHTVTVNLTSGSEVSPIAWPGGAGVTSPVLSFLPIEVAEGDAPKTLRLIKTGSTSLPASKIYVLVPREWRAVPAEGTEPGPVWNAEDGGVLHEVTGTIYFMKPGAAAGERYRIEANMDARQESLILSSAGEVSIHSEDGIETLAGPVTLGILSEGATRAPAPEELLIRSVDDRWRPITDRKITAPGAYEISWRDPEADIQLERRRIAIVPSGGRIVGEMISAQEGRIVHEQLPGWRVDVTSEMTALKKTEGELQFTMSGKPRYRIEALLHPPMGRPFRISVPMKVREAAIILADGSVVSGGQTVDVTALRGAVAASPHATTLTLSSRTDRSNSMQFRFAGEFPLAALKPAVQEMMAPMNDQDAMLELEFLGETRIPIRLRKYRYARPIMVGGAVVFSENFSALPVAKMVLQPAKEHLLQRKPDGSFEIPDWCHGPCLVYLRDGPDIVARPLVVNRPMRDNPTTPLQAALAQTEYIRLKVEVGAALDDLSEGNLPSSDVRLLVDMAVNLNGMPATGFVALQELASRPKALLRLLLSAPAQDRQALWALQQELPFLWLALPSTAWSQVLMSESDALQAALSEVPDDVRLPMIMTHLMGLREKLVEIEPALDSVFVRAGFPPLEKQSLDVVLQGFVQSQRMHDDETQTPVRRNPVLEDLKKSAISLPEDFHRFSFEEFECMAAPAALAAIAAGRLNLSATTELIVRKTLREHAHFVSCAYPHLLKFYEVQA